MIIGTFSLILIGFPFFLVSGSFLTNLSVVLIGLYYIFSLKRPEARKYLNYFIVKLILIFWIYSILSSLLSENIFLSLESSLFYGRFIFFSLGTAFIISQNKETINYFGYSLWACLILLTLDGYLQFFTGANILGWEKFDPMRISSFFGDELILGNFIARLMPLAFFFVSLFSVKNKYLLIFFGLIILMLVDVLIFLSGERTAFFLLILGTMMIIFLVPNFRVMRAITFLFSCLAVILITTQFTVVKERMIDQTIGDMGIANPNQDTVIFSQGHQDHYATAFRMFLDKPLLGHGPKMFREACSNYDTYLYGCSSHPHNTYLQVLSELGIIGLLPLLGLFLYIIFILFRHFISHILSKKKFILRNEEIFLLIAFTITLWPLAPTLSFFTSWINAIYYLPLGFYIYITQNK